MTRIFLFALLIKSVVLNAQNCQTVVQITNEQHTPISYSTVVIDNANKYYADKEGKIYFDALAIGEHHISIQQLGESQETISFTNDCSGELIKLEVKTSIHNLNSLVVTGTKTYRTQLDNPVLVGVTDQKNLENAQACNLGEGLKFQPGLRVETNCQTCNYSQVRINGLSGNYSQILINGRPIFSPLTGLYGLDQIPTNMIDRIEVVKGGGSSLYGSSAIGGTINVITKQAKKTQGNANYFFQSINGQANDHNVNFNADIVHPGKPLGISIYGAHRNRDWYDHNGDKFSEISHIKTSAIGLNSYYKPAKNQKIEGNFSFSDEYRFGGEMIDQPAYLALQAEERRHKVWMGGLDYQLNFNDNKSSVIAYSAFQYTGRTHYTGIYPDDSIDIVHHQAHPPYGNSEVSTLNFGAQINHSLDSFPLGQNVITIGTEYIQDLVYDEIKSYNYLINQNTENYGMFVQSDWRIGEHFNFLGGVRMDKHSMLQQVQWNPRAALIVKLREFTRIQLNLGTGFRAPQAFDTDLHIAFAGGGISRVQLAQDLREESSISYSVSFSTDNVNNKRAFGFTVDGFYTRIQDAFYLKPVGADQFGEIFLKSNGPGASVYGISIEGRLDWTDKVDFKSGITFQKSLFDEEVEFIPNAPLSKKFARTPDCYGFAALDYYISNPWSLHLNYNYTGSMLVPHFAGAPNQSIDEIVNSEVFHTLDTKLQHKVSIGGSNYKLNLYAGVKNIFNAYQSNFDIGKNRDSNFIYGPALPRTYFVGLKLSFK